jgi:hypothetical protein
VTGLPGTGQTLLTEKSSGSFQVMIWNEPAVWNPQSDQPIANSSTSVSVNLGQNFETVQVFDPLQSADAVQTLHNVSALSLDLSDHLLVVQASGAQAASTIPAVQPADTFNFNSIVESAPSAPSPTELNSVCPLRSQLPATWSTSPKPIFRSLSPLWPFMTMICCYE